MIRPTTTDLQSRQLLDKEGKLYSQNTLSCTQTPFFYETLEVNGSILIDSNVFLFYFH